MPRKKEKDRRRVIAPPPAPAPAPAPRTTKDPYKWSVRENKVENDATYIHTGRERGRGIDTPSNAHHRNPENKKTNQSVSVTRTHFKIVVRSNRQPHADTTPHAKKKKYNCLRLAMAAYR
jgi:hypothetical protein